MMIMSLRPRQVAVANCAVTRGVLSRTHVTAPRPCSATALRRHYRATCLRRTFTTSTAATPTTANKKTVVHGEIVQEEEEEEKHSSSATFQTLPLMEQHLRAQHKRLERQLEERLQAYQKLASCEEKGDNLPQIQQALIQVRDIYEELQDWDQALRCEERLELFWTLPPDERDKAPRTTQHEENTNINSSNNNNQLELARSFYRRGRYHMHLGMPKDASKYYQRALDLYNDHHGNDTYHADKGHVIMSLAGVQYAKECHAKALQMLQQESEPHFRRHNDNSSSSNSSSSSSTNAPPPHADLFKCLQHQGLVCRAMEDFSQALQLYQKAKEFLQQTTNSSSTTANENEAEEYRVKLQSINLDIADMHLVLEEWDAALELYKYIWQDDRQYRPRNDKGETPLTAMDGLMLHNIGRIYAQKGTKDSTTLAMETLQDAVEMKKAWWGATHTEVAKSLQLLGAVYARQKQPEQNYQALQCFEQCLTIARVHAQGNVDSDPAVMLALRNIALLEGKKVPRWTDDQKESKEQ